MADSFQRPYALGIEGGGTRTVAILAGANGEALQRKEAGPANFRLLASDQLQGLLQTIGVKLPRPDGICIGLAGARSNSDWIQIRNAAAQFWPGVPCRATNDLETALAAADEDIKARARVLVLSGTGSCCYGRNQAGKTARTGGWGHLLGDRGSGYEIGLRALKLAAQYHDQHGTWPKLGQRIVKLLRVQNPDELIAWVQHASKGDIASLAVRVFVAAKTGDRMATQIVDDAVESLCADAITCARRLVSRGGPVQFILGGGVLIK